MWRRENSWPYWDSNSDPSVVQPVDSRYTDYTAKMLSTFNSQSVSHGPLHLTHCYLIALIHCNVFVTRHEVRIVNCISWTLLTRYCNTITLIYTLNKSLQHTLSRSISEPGLLCDWRFTANQFVLAPSTLKFTTIFILQMNPCRHSPYVTSSLTRGWVCLLWTGFAFVKCTYRTYGMLLKFLPFALYSSPLSVQALQSR
jgi:hypothetical protein